jgi:hypothetical protein
MVALVWCFSWTTRGSGGGGVLVLRLRNRLGNLESHYLAVRVLSTKG